MSSPYRGRFAPSPSGPLHFGSLVAALGSFLQARSQGGQWLVRIEDIDTPRNVAGAADGILRDLEHLGLYWDESVACQSANHRRHRDALAQLQRAGASFRCACSRREVGPGPYRGTCRNGITGGRRPRSVRLRATDRPITIEDAVQGTYRQNLATEVGDFVILRSDGIVAYHLAVTVDDDADAITEVVRGSDLLSSTPRQVQILQSLGLPVPRYAHLPVVVNDSGQKLSKQTHAQAISTRRPGALLWEGLQFLGQQPPRDLADEDATTVLDWAVNAWSLPSVPRTLGIKYQPAPEPVP